MSNKSNLLGKYENIKSIIIDLILKMTPYKEKDLNTSDVIIKECVLIHKGLKTWLAVKFVVNGFRDSLDDIQKFDIDDIIAIKRDIQIDKII